MKYHELKLKHDYDGLNKVTDALNRLAAYEDTGLEPEEADACKIALMGKSLAEIKEIEGIQVERMKVLAKTEAEGRLIVLPCKVGDTVYILAKDGGIKNYIVSGVIIDNNNTWIDIREIDNPYGGGLLNALQFGVDVFRTLDEAEAALLQNYGAKMEGEQNG